VPQWAGSFCRSAQAYVSLGLLLTRQAVKPALHPLVHVLLWQSSVTTEQALPHAPQLFASLVRFTHLPSQFVRPGGHTLVQDPATHIWPPVQRVVQAPQN
jgi:hypothetical protein